MKIEAILIGHAIYSGAGTAGSLWAFSVTDVGLLLLPFSVFLFLLGSDAKEIYQDLKNKKKKKAS